MAGGCGAQWGVGHVVSQGAELSRLARQPWLLIRERAQGQPNPEEPAESPGRAEASHGVGGHSKRGGKGTSEGRRVGPGMVLSGMCEGVLCIAAA